MWGDPHIAERPNNHYRNSTEILIRERVRVNSAGGRTGGRADGRAVGRSGSRAVGRFETSAIGNRQSASEGIERFPPSGELIPWQNPQVCHHSPVSTLRGPVAEEPIAVMGRAPGGTRNLVYPKASRLVLQDLPYVGMPGTLAIEV